MEFPSRIYSELSHFLAHIYAYTTTFVEFLNILGHHKTKKSEFLGGPWSSNFQIHTGLAGGPSYFF